MAERKEPKPSTLKALFAKSGNQCAYPSCTQPVIDDKNILVAQVCHINAVKKSDARLDETLDEEYLRSYENLIILCHAHHKRVDTLEGEYPTECLQQMRRNHEDSMLSADFLPSDSIIADSIYELTSEDFTWDLEDVADQVEELLTDGTVWAQQHMNRMEHNVCKVLDAQLHFLYLKIIGRLNVTQKLPFIIHHESWKREREVFAEASVDSHGGSLAPLEYAFAYASKTRERIAHFRSLITKGANKWQQTNL